MASACAPVTASARADIFDSKILMGVLGLIAGVGGAAILFWFINVTVEALGLLAERGLQRSRGKKRLAHNAISMPSKALPHVVATVTSSSAGVHVVMKPLDSVWP